MRVNKVPAKTGWRWVTEGFSLLAKAPMPLAAIGMMMIFSLLLVSMPRLIGEFLFFVVSPALTFGYLQAVRQVQDGHKPQPFTLYAGLRAALGKGRISLLMIGVFNAVATSAALFATQLVDGGQWLRIMRGGERPEIGAHVPPEVAQAALLFLVLYATTQIALWYAPLFAGLHKTTPVKALIFSVIAVWRNKGAFLVFSIGWFGVVIGISLAASLLAQLLPGQLGTILIIVPLSILLLAALYCSIWLTYRDTVEPIEPETETATESPAT